MSRLEGTRAADVVEAEEPVWKISKYHVNEPKRETCIHSPIFIGLYHVSGTELGTDSALTELHQGERVLASCQVLPWQYLILSLPRSHHTRKGGGTFGVTKGAEFALASKESPTEAARLSDRQHWQALCEFRWTRSPWTSRGSHKRHQRRQGIYGRAWPKRTTWNYRRPRATGSPGKCGKLFRLLTFFQIDFQGRMYVRQQKLPIGDASVQCIQGKTEPRRFKDSKSLKRWTDLASKSCLRGTLLYVISHLCLFSFWTNPVMEASKDT